MREFIHNYDAHMHEAFENFKKAHNKEYISEVDEVARKEVFRQNLRYALCIYILQLCNNYFYLKPFFSRFIHSTNRANKDYQLDVNHLVDRTDLELKALRGKQYTKGYNGGQPFPYNAEEELSAIPDSLDWRLYGAVTPVKGCYLYLFNNSYRF